MGDFFDVRKSDESIEQRLKTLERENVVIHFNCPKCNDEQVTYGEIASDLLSTLSSYNYLVLGYECTNCGKMIKTLEKDCIFGVEKDS
mgnify:CR=1 FL=1